MHDHGARVFVLVDQPTRAVGAARHAGRWGPHLRQGGRLHQLLIAGARLIQQGDHVARQVFGAGDDLTRRHKPGPVHLGARDREAEDLPVALGHLRRRGRVGDRLAHAQRRKDVLTHIAGVCLPCDLLDQQTQQPVVLAVILELRASRRGLADVTHGACLFDQGGGPEIGVRIAFLAQTTGVIEQVADGDTCTCAALRRKCRCLGGRRRVGHLPPRQVALDRRVELELALLDELHHGQCGEALAHRSQIQLRTGRHRPARACLAIAAQHDHLAVFDYGHGQARDMVLPYLRLQKRVEAGQVERRRRWRRGGCRRDEEQRGAGQRAKQR